MFNNYFKNYIFVIDLNLNFLKIKKCEHTGATDNTWKDEYSLSLVRPIDNKVIKLIHFNYNMSCLHISI